MKPFGSLSSQRFKFMWVILTVMLVMALVVVIWGASASPAAASTKAPTLGLKRASVVHTILISENNGEYYFSPASLTIKAGDSVVWKNASDAPHTVTSDTGVFNTPSILSPNQTFMHTFAQAGTFKYHCNIHPYMQATIIVTP
jgi:plastocyanin